MQTFGRRALHLLDTNLWPEVIKSGGSVVWGDGGGGRRQGGGRALRVTTSTGEEDLCKREIRSRRRMECP